MLFALLCVLFVFTSVAGMYLLEVPASKTWKQSLRHVMGILLFQLSGNALLVLIVVHSFRNSI